MCGLLRKNYWRRVGEPLKSSKFNKFVKVEIFHNFPIFFNDHFLLFVVTRVTKHKTVTEGDMLNKIVLKYAPDKIGAGVRGKTADNDE